MFDQLTDPDFDILDDVPPDVLVNAQVCTMDFLADDEDIPPLQPRDRALARQAFVATLNETPEEARAKILQLRTPAAVRHHVAMLSEYDWDFVEQAKELRGYVVSSLLTETKHPDARIRLRSIELLGKLAEVGSFMERSEVTHKQEGAPEIEERLRAKLKSLLPTVMEVENAVPFAPTPVARKQHEE